MLKADDCLHLGFKRQYMEQGRYLAEVTPGFGICAYGDTRLDHLNIQCFAIDKSGMHDLTAEYVSHIVKYANGIDTDKMREEFPYFVAHDLLTVKCLVDEAAERWRTAHGL